VKRLLTLSLLALFLVPAAAGASYPKPDTFVPIRAENGPVPAAPAPTPTAAAPVSRTIITTSGGGSGSTLAIVLASAALGIALGGTAYVAFRLKPMQRSSS
jgi:hypothetical protein